MKKLFLILICLSLLTVQADAAVKQREKSSEGMDRLRQALDMKIFHDRSFVKAAFKRMRENEKSGAINNPQKLKEVGYETLFSEEDVKTIKNQAAHKSGGIQLTKTPWKEQEKAIDQDPFEAFMVTIEQQQPVELKEEDIKTLNTVDKKVIPNTLNLLTESGPSVGAKPVPVYYDENTMVR